MANIAKIKQYCISNGEGLRTAVFFSGCIHRCKGCFNQELWNFGYGEPLDIERVLSLIDEHTAGLSLLGGDPLCGHNATAAIELCKKFKERYPDKTIWLWTGYTLEEVKEKPFKDILKYIDVLIDGKFEEDKYDYNLKWRGSSNQRILLRGLDF